VKTGNFNITRYRMRILIPEKELQNENVLADIVSNTPFMGVHVGDRIWSGSLQSRGLEHRPEPYEYANDLEVSKVVHIFQTISEDGIESMEHQLLVTIDEPYKNLGN